MIRGVIIRFIIYLIISISALFGCAGRLDLPFFWAYLAMVTGAWVIVVATIDRGLLAERLKPAPGGEDRRLPFLVLPLSTAHVVLAGLDARYGWSHVPAWMQAAAMACVIAGWWLPVWAMRINRFFSPVVRLQSERGHRLIDTGPYRWVRHPGYAGLLLYLLTSAVALGSWWAMLPQLVTAILIVRRVVIEDRFLHEQLEGYGAYARRVRWRVIPGAW